MDASRLQIKIYSDNLALEDVEQFVPVFHRWIRENVLDEMVIDVADYTHVHEGAGVVLVGHGSDYYVDQGEGRPGLLYSRKRDVPAGADILEDGLKRAQNATKLLSAEPGLHKSPVFGTKEVLIRIVDRLAVQNDDASFAKVKGEVSAALEKAFGKSFTLKREGNERDALTIRATAA
jgi:hypothetical protein